MKFNPFSFLNKKTENKKEVKPEPLGPEQLNKLFEKNKSYGEAANKLLAELKKEDLKNK